MAARAVREVIPRGKCRATDSFVEPKRSPARSKYNIILNLSRASKATERKKNIFRYNFYRSGIRVKSTGRELTEQTATTA